MVVASAELFRISYIIIGIARPPRSSEMHAVACRERDEPPVPYCTVYELTVEVVLDL